MNLKIEHNPEKERFYAIVEGKTCHLDYETLPDGKTLDFQHTYTPPELRGRQIMYAITKFALEYAIENNLKVIPSCPYVSDFIDNNPEYKKVL